MYVSCLVVGWMAFFTTYCTKDKACWQGKLEVSMGFGGCSRARALLMQPAALVQPAGNAWSLSSRQGYQCNAASVSAVLLLLRYCMQVQGAG